MEQALALVRQQIEAFKNQLKTGGIPGLLAMYSDVLLAAVIMVIIGMMIVPLPHFLLDLLLTVNISFAVILSADP